MKFIFPQNYDFNVKFLGFLDYSTIILNVVWFLVVLLFTSIFRLSLYLKILVIISLVFPIFVFSIVGFNGENIVYTVFYMLKFAIKPKVYLFSKK